MSTDDEPPRTLEEARRRFVERVLAAEQARRIRNAVQRIKLRAILAALLRR